MKDLDERIFAAYFRRFGKDAAQPVGPVGYVESKGKHYAYLSNVKGILAVYHIKEDNSIEFTNPKWFESHVLK